MNRERWANLFWFAFFEYVVFYVGGQAADLLDNWVPQTHEQIVTPLDPNAGLSAVQIGERVFETAGCQACHKIGLVGGNVGPSFSNVGVRRGEGWLRQQLTDPQAHVPGNYMLAYPDLNETQVKGLVAYIKSLDGSRQGPETAGPVNVAQLDRFTPAQIERGQALFGQNCIGCHLIGDQGNALGPNLTHEGLRGRSDEWQKNHLKKPLSVYADASGWDASWPMPSFERLGDDDLDALVAYLQSLR